MVISFASFAQSKNPLLCDTDSGLCAAPVTANKNKTTMQPATAKTLTIIYYTDPICSACWALEPQLRKLKLEYGHLFTITYRMGGLLPSWDQFNAGGISKPADVAHHWDDMSKHFDVPIDGEVWLEDPLPSSYPPSIAFVAARLQNAKKAEVFLRRLREMVFMEKKNITKWEHIEAAALFAKLDIQQLKTDVNGKAIQLFMQDLQMTAKAGVQGFPMLIFTKDNKQKSVYGVQNYEALKTMILTFHPATKPAKINTDTEHLFNHYHSFTAKELSVINGKSIQQCIEMLTALEKAGKLRKHNTKNGAIWYKI